VARTVVVASAQRLGLFYDRRFDCEPDAEGRGPYSLKLGYSSPHTLALATVERGSRVLDLGCAGGYVASLLRERAGCHVTGVDRCPPPSGVVLDDFVLHDLDAGPPPLRFEDYDFVLLLDVLEHLKAPEAFVERLRDQARMAPGVRFVASTANIGFFVNRFMLLLGQFNYGRRGVLDLTHTRLFTFQSFRRLFEQAGFEIIEARGLPGPFPLALGDGRLSRALVRLNAWLIPIARGLFSYQVFVVARLLPSLEFLLAEARRHSELRAAGPVRASVGTPD
jgi:2-polyprenyl-3-methyl-5-hydroxy-6-metoxy-1,4-benzoquinol methylase